MSFVARQISVSIKLASLSQGGGNQPQTFAGTNADTATFSGHRARVQVQNSGGASGFTAKVSIWGLTPSSINQLATMGRVIGMIPRNIITVTAGDPLTGLSAVFSGTIMDAYADFNQAPEVPMEFECLSGGAEAAIPAKASSFTGNTDVATILNGIAQQAGWGFENNEVTAQLSNPYLSGTAVDQIKAVAQAARINAEVINGVLCIWPLYGSRATLGFPLIAPPPLGQMIGYPTYTQQQGIMLRTIFDPRLGRGGRVNVQTSLPRATGTWTVSKIDHILESEMPRGRWESILTLFREGAPQPISQTPSGSL